MIEHVFTIRRPSLRAAGAPAATGMLLLLLGSSSSSFSVANAQTLGYAPADPSLPSGRQAMNISPSTIN
ncbi:MAG TPA: hypothetical protein VNS33_08425 [Bradyrhizobium sp.]|nr:hypothetical protein [Bradyrhizobium sp.]